MITPFMATPAFKGRHLKQQHPLLVARAFRSVGHLVCNARHLHHRSTGNRMPHNTRLEPGPKLYTFVHIEFKVEKEKTNVYKQQKPQYTKTQ